MNIFKMFRELIIFLKYKKTIKKLAATSRHWTNYNFEKGWLGQFGAIVKLRKEDVQDRFGIINDEDMFVKTSIIRHIEPFKEELDMLGISNVIKPVIRRYWQPDKVDVFYELTFWFIFEYTNIKNIFILFVYISILYVIINNLETINNFLMKIIG